MDEILASIRRMIADDDPPPEIQIRPARSASPRSARSGGTAESGAVVGLAASPPAAEARAEAAPPAAAAAPEAAPASPAVPPAPPAAPAAPAAVSDPKPAAQPAPVPAFPFPAKQEPAATIMSPATDAAVASAFSQLAETVLGDGPRSLDSIAERLLRPMLREWLDDNLPALVERLVREEIERVARGRR